MFINFILQGDFIAAFQYLKRTYRKDREGLCQEVKGWNKG